MKEMWKKRILELCINNPLTIEEIAEKLRLPQSKVKKLIRELWSEGLLERKLYRYKAKITMTIEKEEERIEAKEEVKEILLQKRGKLEIKAYITNKTITITCESAANGRFDGITLTLNKNTIEKLKTLLNLIQKQNPQNNSYGE